MGDKASSEIANQAEMVTHTREMYEMYGLPAARLYANSRSLIDDLLGFGEVNWPTLNSGMEHKDTTLPDGSTLLLGMRITKFKREGGVGMASTVPGSVVNAYALHLPLHLQGPVCSGGMHYEHPQSVQGRSLAGSGGAAAPRIWASLAEKKVGLIPRRILPDAASRAKAVTSMARCRVRSNVPASRTTECRRDAQRRQVENSVFGAVNTTLQAFGIAGYSPATSGQRKKWVGNGPTFE